MAGVKDNSALPESYWDDFEENIDTEPLNASCSSKALVSGIDLKDLCDGKEIMFEVSHDEEQDYFDSDDTLPDDIVFQDTRSMRDKRGAPLAGLEFEEVIKGMVNVTEDGFVMKKIVSSGAGKRPPNSAYVTVHYNLYKKKCDIPFDSTYLRNRPGKFRLDQGELILGLEHAIKSMKKNENSIFFIKWEMAFGALGCPERIEKKCDVVADVTLLSFVEIDSEAELTQNEISKIDFQKFINEVNHLLFIGKEDYEKKNVKNAIFSYRKGLRILNNLRLANETEEREFFKLKLKCLVNLAVCYNNMGKPEQACVACQEALSIDRNNLKAIFHYGRANLSLSNFPMAERYLGRAMRIQPDDCEIQKEIKKLNDKKALYEIQDKMFWKKAFQEEDKKEDKKEEKEEDKKEDKKEEQKEDKKEKKEEQKEDKKEYMKWYMKDYKKGYMKEQTPEPEPSTSNSFGRKPKYPPSSKSG